VSGSSKVVRSRRHAVVAVAVAWMFTTAIAGAAHASGGALDPTFDLDGKVTTGFAGGAGARSVAIQSDGMIVAVGGVGGQFGLARYDTAGALDAAFGGDGKVTTDLTAGDDEARAVAVQADGKIVAAGHADQRFAIVRYNDDGTLDSGFGGDGTVVTNFTPGFDIANAVAIQADGKIVAGGASSPGNGSAFALARYNADGSLDTTFGGDGKVTTQFGHLVGAAYGVAIQANGKIVAAGEGAGGNGFALVRYRADGSRDPRFGGDGKVVTRFFGGIGGGAHAVALQPDGKIVAAGTGYAEFGPFAVARYTSTGRLDPTFGRDGKITTQIAVGEETAEDVAIQPNGKIVAAGYAGVPHEFGDPGTGGFALVRYRANGVIDPAFGGDGKVRTHFASGLALGTGVALQQDGGIVVAGWAGDRFALARYLG
jgi:uncharacterized delta-60 repeat protein